MAMVIITILLIICLGGVIYLALQLRTLQRNYSVFTSGTNKQSLDGVLQSILKQLNVTKKDIDLLSSRCDTMEKNERFYIQKIGLLRFNPFKDTGGDQSFILSLVDAYDTGVIITALYSRSGTRWYAKKVVKGKGFEHELSEEEKKALKLAQGISEK